MAKKSKKFYPEDMIASFIVTILLITITVSGVLGIVYLVRKKNYELIPVYNNSLIDACNNSCAVSARSFRMSGPDKAPKVVCLCN